MAITDFLAAVITAVVAGVVTKAVATAASGHEQVAAVAAAVAAPTAVGYSDKARFVRVLFQHAAASHHQVIGAASAWHSFCPHIHHDYT